MRLFKVIFATFLMSFHVAGYTADGDDLIEPCDQVVLAGDAGWPPYIIVNDDGVSGIGVKLAEKIFGQLDIPVKTIAFYNHLELLQALRTGDIDVLVSTYPNNDITSTTNLIQPEYLLDPITVAVKTNNIGNASSWESLAGHNGVMDMTFTADQQSQDFFEVYLNVRDKLDLGKAIDAVLDGDAFYILGSKNQLQYTIAENDLQNLLVISSKVQRPASIYMAFRKGSPCNQYAPFLTKRLQDYKNDGTVDGLVNSYISVKED